jgi:hypothetical protein
MILTPSKRRWQTWRPGTVHLTRASASTTCAAGGCYWPHTMMVLDMKPEERPPVEPNLVLLNLSGDMHFDSIELIGRIGRPGAASTRYLNRSRWEGSRRSGGERTPPMGTMARSGITWRAVSMDAAVTHETGSRSGGGYDSDLNTRYRRQSAGEIDGPDQAARGESRLDRYPNHAGRSRSRDIDRCGVPARRF